MTPRPLDNLLLRRTLLPAQPGTYRLRRFVAYLYRESAAQRRPAGEGLPPPEHAQLLEQEAELALRFDPAPFPAQELGLPSTETLAGLPVFRGTVEEVLPAEVEQGGRTYQAMRDALAPFYAVPAAALSALLWDQHGRSLASLEAFAAATRNVPKARALLPGVEARTASRTALLRQSFGIERAHTHAALWQTFDPLKPDEAGDTATYYPLLDVLVLLATLDLIEAGDVKQPLPPGDCALAFSLPANPEQAEVLYCERDMRHPALPFRGQPGAVENDLRALFRNRARLAQLAEELDELLHYAVVVPGKTREEEASLYVRRDLPPEDVRQALVASKQAEAQRTAQEIGELYLELAAYAARQKETVLAKQRELERTRIETRSAQDEWQERRSRYVELASNIEGLPAHFAAIPTGFAGEDLLAREDQFGRAVLKIRRPPLAAAGALPEKEYRKVGIDLPAEHLEQAAMVEQANLLLSPAGARWVLPQGLVAVSRLYRNAGGFEKPEKVFRLHLNAWVDAMRPHQVSRFKKKGRSEAFGKAPARRPKLLFDALLGFLNRMTFEASDGSTINGFYMIAGSGTDSEGYFADLMLNPKQLDLITGDSPMFLVTNAEAMLGYDRASLDYTPAAQLGLELFARQNLYNKDSATISTPDGGGITRHAYAHKFGLVKGPQDSPKDVLRRFDDAIKNLRKAGVIERVELDGHERRSNPFETKLLVTLNSDYRRAYNLTRQLKRQRDLERQLEAPFAPPPKFLPKAEPPPPRRRGRPKGTKAR